MFSPPARVCFPRNGRYTKEPRFDDEGGVICSRSVGNVTCASSCVISVRRNVGNCASNAFGAMTLDDISGQTVRRCEEHGASPRVFKAPLDHSNRGESDRAAHLVSGAHGLGPGPEDPRPPSAVAKPLCFRPPAAGLTLSKFLAFLPPAFCIGTGKARKHLPPLGWCCAWALFGSFARLRANGVAGLRAYGVR